MATISPEWENDDASDVTEQTAEASSTQNPSSEIKPPADPVKKPKDPAANVLPPVKVVVPEPKPEADNFPKEQAKAYALLKELQRYRNLGPNPSKEDKANHAKYLRLRKHVFAVQQGHATIHVDANSKHAFIGLSVSDRSRWNIKARGDLDFKKILAAHDALAKENEELKKLIES